MRSLPAIFCIGFRSQNWVRGTSEKACPDGMVSCGGCSCDGTALPCRERPWWRSLPLAYLLACGAFFAGHPAAADATRLPVTGRVVDDQTGQPLPCRVYVESSEGDHYLVESDEGSAVSYRVVRGESKEIHTTISAHPFHALLAPGRYTVTAVRGKEYVPGHVSLTLRSTPVEIEIRLKRWIDMASRGWYSGDTHVHRPVDDLPNIMLAEDLNVAFPLTYWVSASEDIPAGRQQADATRAALLRADPTHVVWPVNTEYEITSVAGRPHVLGAFFLLNHRQPLPFAVPPVGPAVDQARREGALVDLDKHNWPWSMMLVPVADVDLFELTNNHVWRTSFLFSRWYTEYAPQFMQIQRGADGGFTERGWIDFGLQTYYALLNCGFRLQPTAGTASGVHPVPLGFGRVYVFLENGFDYDDWIDGLRRGRSFVTTGPMLTVTCNGQRPGASVELEQHGAATVHVRGTARSLDPLQRVEFIVNGSVLRAESPDATRGPSGAFEHSIDTRLRLSEGGWLAVRCFALRPDGRIRFAHTAPSYVELTGRAVVPRVREARYLLSRVRAEIERNRGVLPEVALKEFEQAASAYEAILQRAVARQPPAPPGDHPGR